jgi:hypothetical protein
MSPKMKRYESVEAYLADLPEEVRETLEPIRRAIAAAAPKATETVAYGMPAYEYAERVRAAGFAGGPHRTSPGSDRSAL